MRKFTLLVIGFMIASSSLFAQKSFLGTLTFKMEVSGEGADLVKGMMPDNYQYLVGKEGMLFKMNGGVMASMLGDILISTDGKTTIINHGEKTYSVIEPDAEDKKDEATPKVEAQNETLNIAGYECKKYKVQTTAQGQEVTQYVWVTDKLKIDVSPSSKLANSGANLAVKGINGIPLKIATEVMGMDITLTASEVKEEKLPKTTFEVPKDYEKKDFDPSKLGF